MEHSAGATQSSGMDPKLAGLLAYVIPPITGIIFFLIIITGLVLNTTFLIRELVRVCPVEPRARGFRLRKLFRVSAARPTRGSPGGPDAGGRGEWPQGQRTQSQGAKESTCTKAERGCTGKGTCR